MLVALAGGVGGAKLALGLAQVLAPDELLLSVNTADDFVHLGLRISPDLDTMMYTLAGIANPTLGWGLDGETWSCMETVGKLGGPTWFQLGDRDLATHLMRSEWLNAGMPLSGVTSELAGRLGVRHAIEPATDDRIATLIQSGGERLSFQDYFVRLKCEPRVDAILVEGGENASPAPRLAALLQNGIAGVIICPSNPYLSIQPILAIPALRRWLERRTFCVVAVSPIIAGAAVKGPAAKIARDLGEDASPVAVARFYAGLIDVLVIDVQDEWAIPQIEALGIKPVTDSILMTTLDDKKRLAEICVRQLRALR